MSSKMAFIPSLFKQLGVVNCFVVFFLHNIVIGIYWNNSWQLMNWNNDYVSLSTAPFIHRFELILKIINSFLAC